MMNTLCYMCYIVKYNTFLCFSWQIIVWGDYGRMDHKSFMGAVQILLDDLDLSNMVIGWFKLFPPSSLVDSTLAPLTRGASQTSLDSSLAPVARS